MASPWRQAILPVLFGLELAACASPDTTLQPILPPQSPTTTPQTEDCTGMFIPPKGEYTINIGLDVLGSPSAFLQTDWLPQSPDDTSWNIYGKLWMPDGNGGWELFWEGWFDQDLTIRWQNVLLSVCLDPKSWNMPRMKIEEIEVASLHNH